MVTMTIKEDKIHAQGVKRFERIENKEREQRKLAVEDIKFAQTEDGQWYVTFHSGRPLRSPRPAPTHATRDADPGRVRGSPRLHLHHRP